MIKDILTKNGYNIAGEAENGQKAVEKYAELKPDLVLMDITMPEMDGIEALKRIKAADPSASVIMCSAMGQQAILYPFFVRISLIIILMNAASSQIKIFFAINFLLFKNKLFTKIIRMYYTTNTINFLLFF